MGSHANNYYLLGYMQYCAKGSVHNRFFEPSEILSASTMTTQDLKPFNCAMLPDVISMLKRFPISQSRGSSVIVPSSSPSRAHWDHMAKHQVPPLFLEEFKHFFRNASRLDSATSFVAADVQIGSGQECRQLGFGHIF